MFLTKIKILLIVTGILLFSLTCSAQQTEKATEPSLDQQTADLALLSAIRELREVKDLSARVSLAGSIVTMLAKHRPTSCREMLDEIFREILKQKQELSSPTAAANKPEDKKEKFVDPDVVILSLIKIAAKFDAALAKKYTEDYTTEKDSKNNSPLQDELKLKLATQMIESDPQGAITLATQALLSGVKTDVLIFLATLREKNISLADNFAVTALRSIESRYSNEDVNELLIIFAYIFTPQLVPIVHSGGLAFRNIPAYQDISENYPTNLILAQQFTQSSMRILLAPARYAQGNLAERAFPDSYLLGMLEPYSTSIDLAATIRKQKSAITQYLLPDQLARISAQLGRWNELRLKSDDTKQKGLPMDADYFSKRAEQEKDPNLKDRLFYHAASNAVREKKYETALEFVSLITLKHRDKAEAFINYQIAWQAIQDKKFELTEKYLSKESNLPRRAFLLTLMAESFVSSEKKDTGKASELLSQVTSISTKLDTDREKAAVFFGAAKVYAAFDPGRAFGALGNAVEAANKLENFDGKCHLVSMLEIGGFGFDYTLYHTELTLTEAVDRLSKINFGETLNSVRQIKNPIPRLQAVTLSCQSPLSKKESGDSKN